MGARQQRMPFWPPFLTACEQFIKNMSSPRIKLIIRLFYQIRLNPAKGPSANPFGRGYLHLIRRIYRSHAVAGANNLPWWLCLWVALCWVTTPILYYSYHKKPMEQEFFASARTKIVVKLLTKRKNGQNTNLNGTD
jgi:hypothetical protein